MKRFMNRSIVRGNRRGSALMLVLLMSLAMAALGFGAVYMSSSAGMLTRHYDREREFRYASEAALAVGKTRMMNDTSIKLPDSGYVTLMSNASIAGADGQSMPGVKVNLYAGRSGSGSGQFGLYVSLVSEARDPSGARYVRRLELADENFAKYLAFFNTGTQNVCYSTGEVMFGPVWSNVSIGVCGGSFKDFVGTVGTMLDKGGGATYKVPPKTNQPRIPLPTATRLAKLAGYAAAGNLSFSAPDVNASQSQLQLRLEFVALDLDGDGQDTSANEGFLRVFTANQPNEARADYTGNVPERQCGDWHPMTVGGVSAPRFFPVSVHNAAWFDSLRVAYGWVLAPNEQSGSNSTRERAVLTPFAPHGQPRCYPAGDPHLVATDRPSSPHKGGDDTTFTIVTNTGRWSAYPGAVPAALSARYPAAIASTLFPLFRADNPGTKGVIYVNGSVGLSGILRGKYTLYATKDIGFLDDLVYATDPASTKCRDILGLIAGNSAWISDNAINTPQTTGGAANSWLSDNRGFLLHGVVMALTGTLGVENMSSGPTSATTCSALPIGRGCFAQTGGEIVQSASATFDGNPGHGFMETRAYDLCMKTDSPPYFPTTGRYSDNRYYEIDPVGFNVAFLFARLQPLP
ncbi:MAG: hypothetical protein M3068_13170 [Gemmatimonadota bacterium]|nr:hypothetical protein [Gemmatimonadota bacterium]